MTATTAKATPPPPHEARDARRQSSSRDTTDDGCGAGCGPLIKPMEECQDDDDHCIPLGSTGYCCVNSPAPVKKETPPPSMLHVAREISAEALGTLMLVFVVVGSGIHATLLSEDVGVQLLINSVATMGSLYGLIHVFGPVSGAHFNPCVSFVDYLFGDMSLSGLARYTVVQILGGIVGSILANLIFDVPTEISTTERYAYNLWISEVISTASLLMIIHGCIRTGEKAVVPQAVAVWVGGGYFFTSSTIFANPAVTIGRTFTNTFAGIEPKSMAVYIPFQYLGALIGYGLVRFFYPKHTTPANKEDTLYRRVCILAAKDFFEQEAYH